MHTGEEKIKKIPLFLSILETPYNIGYPQVAILYFQIRVGDKDKEIKSVNKNGIFNTYHRETTLAPLIALQPCRTDVMQLKGRFHFFHKALMDWCNLG